jgi:uncharacterized membrane protein
MSQTPVPPQAAVDGTAIASSSLISTTLLVYVLFGIAAVAGVASHGIPLIAPLMGLLGIIAVIIAYVKRDDARGTWIASHLRWLIRTFWFSFLWGVVGMLLFITIIGIPVAWALWVATTIWVLYRLVRGYILFKDSRPVPGM